MTTEKQIAANKANAQKSTGPKTDAGKQVVAMNAISHGILSRRHIGIGMDQTTIALESAFWRQVDRKAEQEGKDWRELIAGMLKDKPEGFGRAGWLRVSILEAGN